MIDAADCYNGGNSERDIGEFLKRHSEKNYIRKIYDEYIREMVHSEW